MTQFDTTINRCKLRFQIARVIRLVRDSGRAGQKCHQRSINAEARALAHRHLMMHNRLGAY